MPEELDELELLLDEPTVAPLLELELLELLDDELELVDELELLLELEDELDDPELLSSPCPPQAASSNATATMVSFFMKIPGKCYAFVRRFVMFFLLHRQNSSPKRLLVGAIKVVAVLSQTALANR